ncbi:MAG: hypothetical protein M3619_24635 [Myxococcota bacterium]|nr:hypothetical protein [Myxococcota bacterium]
MLKRSLPPALLVGLLVGMLGDLLQLVTGLARNDVFDRSIRWELFWLGLFAAEYLLITVGLFELARRATGQARTLLRVAAGIYAALLVWHSTRPVLDVFYIGSEWIIEVHRYSYVAVGVLSLVVAIVVIVAARGFVRAPAAAFLMIIAVLARGWVPYIGESLHRYLWENQTVGVVYWMVIGMMWTAGLAWLAMLIDGDHAESTTDGAITASGLRLAASALRFRVIVAIVIAVAMVGMVRSAGGLKLAMIGGPAVILASMVVCTLGLLAAVRGALPDLPRWRIVLGATITIWWAGVQLHQLLWLYRSIDGSFGGIRDNAEWLQAWSILGPLAATAGLALAGSAISSYAAARANDELREAASVRTLLFVVLSASGIAITSQLFKASSQNGFILLALIGAGASIAALISLAGLFTRAAETIASGPTLPTARVHDPG